MALLEHFFKEVPLTSIISDSNITSTKEYRYTDADNNTQYGYVNHSHESLLSITLDVDHKLFDYAKEVRYVLSELSEYNGCFTRRGDCCTVIVLTHKHATEDPFIKIKYAISKPRVIHHK
jgi:hypothetical protein